MKVGVLPHKPVQFGESMRQPQAKPSWIMVLPLGVILMKVLMASLLLVDMGRIDAVGQAPLPLLTNAWK